MQSKRSIFFLTLIVTVLSLYYLSFTFVSQNIQSKAEEYATEDSGILNFSKKQQYLDSLWDKKVYDLLFADFTLKEVKERELNLGLDLQGGMHVTLEISPISILKVLSDNSQNPIFLNAIQSAQQKQKDSQQDFTTLFFESFEENSDVSLANIFANSANKGLIDFGSSNEEIKKIISDEIEGAIDRTFNIIRTRIDKFGVSQPNIQRIPGSGRIQVELPGADNPERVRKLLQGVAKLEFVEVWSPAEVSPYLQAADKYLIKKEKEQRSKEVAAQKQETSPDTDISDLIENANDSSTSTAEATETTEDPLDNLTASVIFRTLKTAQRNGFFYSLSDTAQVTKALNDPKFQSYFPPNLYFVWAVKTETFQTQELLELFAIKRDRNGNAPLTGEVIVDARQGFDQNSRPEVSMSMNVKGAKIWRRMTAQNVGRQVGIVLDNYAYSAPYVRSVIEGGRSSIAGNFTIEEALDLANILKAGKLPAPTRIVEEAVIGPSLGKASQQQGLVSITAGLLLVILFMVFYYNRGGLVANAALLFNIFFIVGILAQLNAALTLPGIAGIVLTIGMSIDANVLIFERIKEEMRAGVGIVAQAIKQGYSKVFWTIFDANLTTLLTAIFLYIYGSGPIKGFAVTLIIGIFSSFFTSVFVTRLILSRLLSDKKEVKPSYFNTPLSNIFLSKKEFDFISKRKISYLFSVSVIAIGILILAFNGLNLGVDFKGGRSYTVEFSSEVNPSNVEVALTKQFQNAGIETKLFGSDNVVKVTTSYLVDDESTEADELVKKNLIEGITKNMKRTYTKESKLNDQEFTISSTTKVGATIADDIEMASRTSVIFSLIAIFLYIWVRFRRWKFGLGAVIALFHDTLMIFSIFAILTLLGIAFEIDQVFVAAMLTIIGYSINDTVVVFDRVREMLGIQKKGIVETFNTAINKTINRTMITSLTTLLVVLILLVFGGEILRGFSFALFIGILFGTYSSIFIATPIVLDSEELVKKWTSKKKTK